MTKGVDIHMETEDFEYSRGRQGALEKKKTFSIT